MSRPFTTTAVAALVLVAFVLVGCSGDRSVDPAGEDVLGEVVIPTEQPPKPTAAPTAEPSPVPSPTPEPTRAPSPIERVEVPQLNLTSTTKTLRSIVAPIDESSDWIVGGSVSDRKIEQTRPVVWSNSDVAADGWTEVMLPVGAASIGADPVDNDPTESDLVWGEVEQVIHAAQGAIAIGSIGSGSANHPAIWQQSTQGWLPLDAPPQIDSRPTALQQIVEVPDADGPEELVLLGTAADIDGQSQSIVWTGTPGDWSIAISPSDEHDRAAVSRVRSVGDRVFALGWAGTGDGTGDDDSVWMMLWTRRGDGEWELVDVPTIGTDNFWLYDIVYFKGNYILTGGRDIGGVRHVAQWKSVDGLDWSQSVATIEPVTDHEERVLGGGWAFDEVVAAGDQLFATSSHSFLPYVFESEVGVNWRPVALLHDLSRSDVLHSLAGRGDTLALIHDNSGLQVFDGNSWTRGSDELRGGSKWLALRAVVASDDEVVLSGEASTLDQLFPRFWLRRSGEWIRGRNSANGRIHSIRFDGNRWVGVGESSETEGNYRSRIWTSSPTGLRWETNDPDFPNTQDRFLSRQIVDGKQVILAQSTDLSLPATVWTTAQIVHEGDDGLLSTDVPYVAWWHAFSTASCTHGNHLSAFLQAAPLSAVGDDVQASLTALTVRADGSYEMGDLLGGELSETAAVNDCVTVTGADSSAVYAIGSVEVDGAHRARVWSSQDGLEWGELDLGALQDRRSWFSDVVEIDGALLLTGADPVVETGTTLWLMPTEPDPSPDRAETKTVALHNPLGVDDPASINLVDVTIAGDEIILIGTESGYNRVWTADARALLEHILAEGVPVG